MPEYLAPGVYVEEVSFRSKSIEGVSTTTTGFVGPTRYGPIDMVPDVLTSLGDFERVYGDRKQLVFSGSGTAPTHNYMWHAVRAFFEEGGKRLYVSRIFKTNDSDDGHARKRSTLPHTITVKSRTSGLAGKVTVGFALNLGQNILNAPAAVQPVDDGRLSDNDIVWLPDVDPTDSNKRLKSGTLYIAKHDSTENKNWIFYKTASDIPANPSACLMQTAATSTARVLDPSPDRDTIQVATIAIIYNQSGLAPSPTHKDNNHQSDSIFDILGDSASSTTNQALPIITRDGGLQDGILVLETLFALTNGAIATPDSPPSKDLPLELGNDGYATATLTGPSPSTSIIVKARFRGGASNIVVHFTLNVGQNILGKTINSNGTTSPTVGRLLDNDIVWLPDVDPTDSNKRLKSGTLYIAKHDSTENKNWIFYKTASDIPANPSACLMQTTATSTARVLDPSPDRDTIRVVTITVTTSYNQSGFSPNLTHKDNNQLPDSIFDTLSVTPPTTTDPVLPILIRDGGTTSWLQDGILVLETLFSLPKPIDPDHLPSSKDLPLELGNDGYATKILIGPPPPSTSTPFSIMVKARFPGDAGNVVVRFTPTVGQSILGRRIDSNRTLIPTISSLLDNDIVWLPDIATDGKTRLTSGTLYIAKFDSRATEQTWKFYKTGSAIPASPDIQLKPTTPTTDAPRIIDPSLDTIRVVTITVTVIQSDGSTSSWSGLATDPRHVRNDQADSLFDVFSETPSNRDLARSLPIIIRKDDEDGTTSSLKDGILVLETLFSLTNGAVVPDNIVPIDVLLEKGNDGALPTFTEYEGEADPTKTFKTGLKTFEDIDDISIVAAPGSTAKNHATNANAIVGSLIGHAQYMNYRIAILDSREGLTIKDVREMRAKFDSKHAALYYPWVRILDPVTRVEINLPPSGFVAGIYARNDRFRAVYKAPANEVVNLALGFELMLNKAQQEVLNPEGINCFRFFEGRGYRLWGARTISSDSEWKYVNLRRYFAYLEHSIDKGTQFAVFEPNGPLLWANVRRTIEDFLLNEWQNGALLGDKPETSYFVRCDRSTMTQNDLDNGRLIVLIGVAPLRPAEFVIFRIGQWTGDRRG